MSILLFRVLKNTGKVYLAKDNRVEDSLIWVYEFKGKPITYPLGMFNSIDDFKDYVTYRA